MPSINLSQSIQERQALARGAFFDKGFFVNLGILLLVLATYGGVHWYANKLNKEYLGLQSQVAEKTASLKGDDVNLVADFRERLDTIAKNLDTEPDPSRAFEEFERLVVPSVKATRYAYMRQMDEIQFEGETNNMRYLAQQMLAFKRLSRVEKVHVQSVEYNTQGIIEFGLTMTLVPEPKSSTSSPSL